MTRFVFILTLSFVLCSAERSFVLDRSANCFRKDGRCFQYISGSMHYFRIIPEYWNDRLMKLKAAGFNTVQTYIPWNIHEPREGEYNFEEGANIVRFINHAEELGLLVLFRPGPFIAAEFEFGGFPIWLTTKNCSMSFRTSEPSFMAAVTKWYNYLLPMLKPHLYHNGGNVIGFQVENEYGSNPSCDLGYLSALTKQFYRLLGEKTLLLSVNGPGNRMLDCGTLSQLYNTVDFGSGANVTKAFDLQAKYNSGGPPVNSEFYPGWLSLWGSKFPSVPTSRVTKTLGDMLEAGASVNMYMFHGGTNFGFTSGGKGNNADTVYVPHTTTYDYDAPLSENGDTTLKYFAIRKLLSKYSRIYPIPANNTRKAYSVPVQMKQLATVLDERMHILCGKLLISKNTLTMEEFGQTNGLMIYSTNLPKGGALNIAKVRDRAYVYSGITLMGIIKGTSLSNTTISVLAGELNIIVISDGHINTGHVQMSDVRSYMKGILTNVTVDGKIVMDYWRMVGLPLDNMRCLAEYMTEDIYRNLSSNPPSLSFVPSFYIGLVEQECDSGADTYLNSEGWGKGVAFFGTNNIGRYWPLAGPQVTLYVPGKFCEKVFKQAVVMLELEKPAPDGIINLVKEPNLHGPVDPSQL